MCNSTLHCVNLKHSSCLCTLYPWIQRLRLRTLAKGLQYWQTAHKHGNSWKIPKLHTLRPVCRRFTGWRRLHPTVTVPACPSYFFTSSWHADLVLSGGSRFQDQFPGLKKRTFSSGKRNCRFLISASNITSSFRQQKDRAVNASRDHLQLKAVYFGGGGGC